MIWLFLYYCADFQVPLTITQQDSYSIRVKGSGGLNFDATARFISVSRKISSIFIQTDKAAYKPGDLGKDIMISEHMYLLNWYTSSIKFNEHTRSNKYTVFIKNRLNWKITLTGNLFHVCFIYSWFHLKIIISKLHIHMNNTEVNKYSNTATSHQNVLITKSYLYRFYLKTKPKGKSIFLFPFSSIQGGWNEFKP